MQENLPKWQKISLAVLAVISFFAGLYSSSILDGLGAALINYLILFGIFKIMNSIMKKYNERKTKNPK